MKTTHYPTRTILRYDPRFDYMRQRDSLQTPPLSWVQVAIIAGVGLCGFLILAGVGKWMVG